MFEIVEQQLHHKVDLEKLFLELRRKTFSWLDSSTFFLHDFKMQTKGEIVLVALVDGDIAGFISLWVEDNFIHHLYVKESYQHRHIGTALINAASEKLSFPITLKCLEQNENAIRFYKNKGFTEKETGISSEGKYILFERS